MSSPKGSLNPTTLFVLAYLLLRQKRSFYELREETGLSPGIISPALAALESAGLVTFGHGTRGRLNVQPTEQATVVLDGQWQKCLDPDVELETALRAAWVGSQMERRTSAGVGTTASFVSAAAQRRTDELKQHRSPGGGWRLLVPELDPDDYPSMRSLARLRRLQYEEIVLTTLARALKEAPGKHLAGAEENRAW
jgi:DNA-binding transcriptional ArsR family regulator